MSENILEDIVENLHKTEPSEEKTTETYGITHSFDEWKNVMTNYHKSQLNLIGNLIVWDKVESTSDGNDIPVEYYGLLDVEAVNWMSHVCVDKIAGYMTHPVVLYKGKAIPAKVYVYDDIEDVKKIEGKIFLYEITYFYPKPEYFRYDVKTFEPFVNESLVLTKPKWKIRYGRMEEDT